MDADAGRRIRKRWTRLYSRTCIERPARRQHRSNELQQVHDSVAAGARRSLALHFRPRHVAAGALTGRCFVAGLFYSADIHRGKRHLQKDERIGAIVNSPHNPEDVAEQEDPETPGSPAFVRRCNQPRCDDRRNHGRPLNETLHQRTITSYFLMPTVSASARAGIRVEAASERSFVTNRCPSEILSTSIAIASTP